MYTPAESRTPAQVEALKLSDELIGELQAADVYVFGVPMYNFSVPSVFKAYIDQVVRAGVTFNPANYQGLLLNKKMFSSPRAAAAATGRARRAKLTTSRTRPSAPPSAWPASRIRPSSTSTTRRVAKKTDAALAAAREQIKTLTAA